MNQDINIRVVNSTKDFKAFVKFPFDLYQDNPYWVPPLINEEIETIDPKVNPVYQNAVARFFLAYRGDVIVGRIAAMINWIEVNEVGKSKVRFGWFDVIDDLEVSKLLLEQVRLFGQEHNLKIKMISYPTLTKCLNYWMRRTINFKPLFPFKSIKLSITKNATSDLYTLTLSNVL